MSIDLQILCSHISTSSSFLKTSQRDRWVFCTTVVAQVPSMNGQWPAVFLQLQELLLNLAIFSTCESQILGALWHKKFAWKEPPARAPPSHLYWGQTISPCRGAFFAWRAPIVSWPRIMCSQVRRLIFFRTVTRNAVNRGVWRKADCSWLPLNKHAMNIWLSSPRIRAHLSWKTGKHVLRTYSTCSYPGY